MAISDTDWLSGFKESNRCQRCSGKSYHNKHETVSHFLPWKWVLFWKYFKFLINLSSGLVGWWWAAAFLENAATLKHEAQVISDFPFVVGSQCMDRAAEMCQRHISVVNHPERQINWHRQQHWWLLGINSLLWWKASTAVFLYRLWQSSINSGEMAFFVFISHWVQRAGTYSQRSLNIIMDDKRHELDQKTTPFGLFEGGKKKSSFFSRARTHAHPELIRDETTAFACSY